MGTAITREKNKPHFISKWLFHKNTTIPQFSTVSHKISSLDGCYLFNKKDSPRINTKDTLMAKFIRTILFCCFFTNVNFVYALAA